MSEKSNSITNDLNYFKKALYNHSVDKKFLFRLLKEDYSFQTIKKIVRNLDTHPFVKKYFYGTPFPKKINSLGETFYPFPTVLSKELLIETIPILKYSKELNIIINLKNEFEKTIFLRNYTEARNILNLIEQDYGYSLWLIESRFILEELQEGFKNNLEYLNFINQNSSHVFVTALSHYYSLKAENKTSAITYNLKINSFLKEFEKNFSDYVSFKLNYFDGLFEFTELLDIISYESIFSVFDRYLTFIKICQIISTNEKFIDLRQYVKEAISELVNYINDTPLRNLAFAYEIQSIPSSENDILLFELYENYTKGNYEETIRKCKELIEGNPMEFTFLELYTKSILYLSNNVETENEFLIGKNENSLINECLKDIYFLLFRSEHTPIAVSNILKKITTFQSFNWSSQLYSFLLRNSTDLEDLNIERLKYLNTIFINPLLYKAFINEESGKTFLLNLNSKYNLNVFQLFLLVNFINSKEDIIKFENLEIPKERKLFYKGKALQKINELEEASICFEELVEINLQNINQYEESLIELLKLYFQLGKFERYIEIYSRNSIRNLNIVSRINFEGVSKILIDNKFKNVSHTIFLPIFLRLTNQKNHIINVSIRKFLLDNALNRVKDVVDLPIYAANKSIVIYFLANVCTPEIIKYFTNFKKTKDILNERVDICQTLISIDSKNKEIYGDEISRIVKNLVILEAIKEVDDSKIYVDEKGLRNNELKQTKNNFLRYVEISDLIKKVPLLFIDLLNNKKILINIAVGKYTEEEFKKSKTAENIKFELFKELFFEIRDAFLFNNKYGLDSYLSTRIRHGTLLGQIRSQFQDQFLITQKDKDSQEYFDNEYWKNKLSDLQPFQLRDIQDCLATFSSKIDNLTNFLKNDLIQIKTDSKITKGLFDYTFPVSNFLYYYNLEFQNISDYNIFLDMSFKLLWDQTSLNLEIIRQHISTTVKEDYIKCLDELDNELKKLKIDSKEFQELNTNVINCKTNISYEIDKIADWFQIKEIKIKDFQIKKAIDTSLEITNRISNDTKIQPNLNSIVSFTEIRGEFFISFFDLLTIFLSNIVKYSHLATSDLVVFISATEKDQTLIISIQNNLNSNIEKETLVNRFQEKYLELNKPNWDMDKIKKEEESGFFKAKKILTTDLQCDSNSFTVEINKNKRVEILININLTNIKS